VADRLCSPPVVPGKGVATQHVVRLARQKGVWLAICDPGERNEPASMEPTPFAVTSRLVGDTVVVSVAGELDLATSPQLQESLEAELEAGRSTIVVSLEETTFLDSTALGVLVQLLKRCREAGGDLSVVITDPRIARIFAITGLQDTFSIVTSLDAADPGRVAE
jgi:anti-sigma B factor antagonist